MKAPSSPGLDSKWLVVGQGLAWEPYVLFLLSAESAEDKADPSSPGYPAIPAQLLPDGCALVSLGLERRTLVSFSFRSLKTSLRNPAGSPSRTSIPSARPDARWANRVHFGATRPACGSALSRSDGGRRSLNGWRSPAREAAYDFPARPVGIRADYPRCDVWRLELNGGRLQKPATDLISSTRIDHDARYSDGKRIVFGRIARQLRDLGVQ
jgi:hypothetical protein